MPKYIGINNVAREVVQQYVGISNVAREVSSEYVGVNNVAREVFSSRDLSKNMWRVVSLTTGGSRTDSVFSAVENRFSPLSGRWLYSKINSSGVTLCSTIRFLKGDTFNITFCADMELSEDNERFNDAYGQACLLEVYNSNDTSNKTSISLYTERERREQTVNFTMTADGYLQICMTLEGCGENYISSSVNIEINNTEL